jgi:hypothetical protein
MAEFYITNDPQRTTSPKELAEKAKTAEPWTEYTTPNQQIHAIDDGEEGQNPQGVTLSVNPGYYNYFPGEGEHGQGKLFDYSPPSLNMLHGTADVSEATVQKAMALAWKHAVDATGHLTYSTSLSPFSVRAVKYARDRGLVVDPRKGMNFEGLYNERFTNQKERAMDQLKDQYENEYRNNTNYYDNYYGDEYVDECHDDWGDCEYCNPVDEEGDFTGEGSCYECDECRYGEEIEPKVSDNSPYDENEEQQYIADKMKGIDEQKAAAMIFRQSREAQGQGPALTALSTKDRYDYAQNRKAERAPQTILGRVDSPREVDPREVAGDRITKATPEQVQEAVTAGLKHGLEHKRNLKSVRSIEDLQEEANTEYDARVGMDSDETNLFGEALNPRTRAQSKADLPDDTITSPRWKTQHNNSSWQPHVVAQLEMPPNGPERLTEQIGIPLESVGSTFYSSQRRRAGQSENTINAEQAASLRDRITSSPGLTAALNAHYEDNRNTYESLYGDQDSNPRPQAGSRSAAFSTGNTETNEETATNRSFFNK